jgi:hypothetical protein
MSSEFLAIIETAAKAISLTIPLMVAIFPSLTGRGKRARELCDKQLHSVLMPIFLIVNDCRIPDEQSEISRIRSEISEILTATLNRDFITVGMLASAKRLEQPSKRRVYIWYSRFCVNLVAAICDTRRRLGYPRDRFEGAEGQPLEVWGGTDSCSGYNLYCRIRICRP